MLELIAAERPATLGGVPTMLIGMLDHPGFRPDGHGIGTAVVTGGAVVPPALVGRVEAAFGAPVSIVFAQTEASPVITQTSPQDTAEDRAHTLGRPLPQTEVKITDPASGQTVAPGVTGELCTRGYHVMTGYFRDPDKTAAAIDADGWLHTGDLASMDERGYCQIAGRLKDMIIRGGENIYPREIEQVLFGHPAVADVAVVGVPDAKWGEQVAAFIRPAPGQTPDPDLDGDEKRSTVTQRAGPHQHRPGGHDAGRLGGEQRPVADDDRYRAAIGQRQPGGISLDPAAGGRAGQHATGQVHRSHLRPHRRDQRGEQPGARGDLHRPPGQERAAAGQGVGQHRAPVPAAGVLPPGGSRVKPGPHDGCLLPVPGAGPQHQAASALLALGRFLPHRLARRRRHHPGQLADHPDVNGAAGWLQEPAGMTRRNRVLTGTAQDSDGGSRRLTGLAAPDEARSAWRLTGSQHQRNRRRRAATPFFRAQGVPRGHR